MIAKGSEMEQDGLPMSAPVSQEEEAPHLKEYVRTILGRKWILINTFIICVALATIYVFMATPVYRTSSRLEIQPVSVDADDVKAVYDPTLTNTGGWALRDAFLKTQYQLILCDPVVEKTLRQYRKELPDWGAGGFRNLFSVSSIKETWLVDVGCEYTDPVLAARFVNSLVDTYEKEFSIKAQGVQRETLDRKNMQLQELEETVQEKGDALAKFRNEKGIHSLGNAADTITQRYDNLVLALNNAILNRIDAESRYLDIQAALEEGRLEEMPEIFGNAAIESLKLELINANLTLQKLSQDFGSTHPEVVSTQENVDFITRQIETEKNAVLVAVKSGFKRAQQAEERLEEIVAVEKAKVSEIIAIGGEYTTLQREFDQAEGKLAELNRDINALVLTLAGKGEKEKNISVVNEAKVIPFPVKPQKAFTIALAGLVGVMLGIGLCLLVDYLDTTIKSKDDVEKALGLPTLGYVPPITPVEGNGETTTELVALEKPRSLLAESFRSIRTALTFSKAGRGLKSILVTSAMPEEGKTTVASNIALTLAIAGKRVLIVDSDMRRPRLNKAFGLSAEPGLSNLLSGDDEGTILANVLRGTRVKSLFVLPSGPNPPNPAELLGSQQMEDLAARLEERYDFVIYDTPPILSATDSAIASQYVDGVVMVVRSFRTEVDLAGRARETLKDAQANILGVVLNNADVPKSGYYGYGGYGGKYYHYYYHPYYYSDDKTKAVRKRKRRGRSRRQSKEDASGTGESDVKNGLEVPEAETSRE